MNLVISTNMLAKRSIIILVFVIVLTWISWLTNGRSLLGIDDANIYLVYMRNFANGNGFVYNIGGEKVEGFTSLLWTLIGAFFYLFTPTPEKLLLGFNIILTTISIYKITRWIDSGDKSNKIFTKKSLLLLGLIAVTPGFIDWTVLSLLETGLWSFLLTITSLKIISPGEKTSAFKHHFLLAALFTMLILCRPEAMLWVPVFILMDAYRNWRLGKDLKQILIQSLPLWAVFIAVLSAFIAWRLSYFGYPLPNTYYAKVSNNRFDNLLAGVLYLEKSFLSKPYIFLIFLFASFKICNNIYSRKKTDTSYILLYVIMAVTFIIPLYAGGDHFGHQRFIIPTLALIISILIFSFEDQKFWSKPVIFLALSFVFFSCAYNLKDLFLSKLESPSKLEWDPQSGWKVKWYKPIESPVKPEWEITEQGRKQAELLNNFFVDNVKLPSQGVFMAGAMAYSYKGETIDVLGLNNVKMAHAKKQKDRWILKNHASFDKNTFYIQAPDLFWYGPSTFSESGKLLNNRITIDSTSFGTGFSQNIQNEEKFKDLYGFYRIKKKHFDKELNIFSKHTFIEKLDTTKYKTQVLALN